MLRVEGLTVGYGNTTVVDGVSLCIREGELVTVIGANGAGKSTLLAAIVGLLPVRSGTVTFDGRRLDHLSVTEVVRAGVILCPERRHLFPAMSVRENLQLGAYRFSDRKRARADLDRVLAMFPTLVGKLRLQAGLLSGGEQQMVAIGRSLMGRPRVLLLDEPSLGLAPILVRAVMTEIGNILKGGVSLCLVEQNAKAALAIAQRGYVLESGKIAMEGEAAALASDERIVAAYLGVS